MTFSPRTLFVAGLLLLAACVGPAIVINGIDFGNNASKYARDGECDDPRFAGAGMATSLAAENVGRDGTDCSQLYLSQNVRLARSRSEWRKSQCVGISYGNNSSEYASDGRCDDPRFTGPGTASVLLLGDLKHDAKDCRTMCLAGEAWLR